MLHVLSVPFHKLKVPPRASFQGQTVLCTGANTGLAREACRHALQLGASKVLMGVRTLSKGEQAREDVLTSTKAPKDAVEVWPLDMESFESVKTFARRVEDHINAGGRLDVAILNAGLATGKWSQTRDGWEKTLQVNDLSTALLSLRLLPLLERSSATNPHLVIVASDIHFMLNLKNNFQERHASDILQALNDRQRFERGQAANPAERYAVSKLLDIYIAIEMAALASKHKSKVVVNCVTPGFCKSDLLSPARGEKAPLVLRILQRALARDVVEGSLAYIDAALKGPESHGMFLENQVFTDPGSVVTGEDAIRTRQKVWGEIVEVFKRDDPTLAV
ncbi:hypothetical protein PV08_08091 [Exophiala spinifera]|uniref:Uncharacterized protein n=1 Tax=Exophiala spinifera TaxID=91928 RepID=A0A0D2BP84_9EURO|nr:uncharacterized protein PV08_08091 [Exophiala spinifera]KIW12904.1 hypothetical protein PV08_08091 [Exophiala spinifera]